LPVAPRRVRWEQRGVEALVANAARGRAVKLGEYRVWDEARAAAGRED
jgi:hypothetical protein